MIDLLIGVLAFCGIILALVFTLFAVLAFITGAAKALTKIARKDK